MQPLEENLDFCKIYYVGKGKEPAGEERDLILKAAYSGDHRVLVEYSARGLDIISARDWDGETVLHKAALGGQTELMKVLVDAGANVNAKNIVGLTPLHKAAWNGHYEVMRILVDSGAIVDHKTNGGLTPLAIAASKNHQSAIKFLVNQASADMTMIDQELQQKIDVLLNVQKLTGSNNVPTLRDLHRHIRAQVAFQWYDLGVELLNPNQIHELDIIKCDSQGHAEICCTEMFKYWLQVDVDANWHKLAKALQHIGHDPLAEKIANEYL